MMCLAHSCTCATVSRQGSLRTHGGRRGLAPPDEVDVLVAAGAHNKRGSLLAAVSFYIVSPVRSAFACSIEFIRGPLTGCGKTPVRLRRFLGGRTAGAGEATLIGRGYTARHQIDCDKLLNSVREKVCYDTLRLRVHTYKDTMHYSVRSLRAAIF